MTRRWIILGAVTLVSAYVLCGRRSRLPCIEDMAALYQEYGDYNDITIAYPLHETLFPPEAPAPLFRWKDSETVANAWLIRVAFTDDVSPMCFRVQRAQWRPPQGVWDVIKQRSVDHAAQVTILGINPRKPARIVSQAVMSFRT